MQHPKDEFPSKGSGAPIAEPPARRALMIVAACVVGVGALVSGGALLHSISTAEAQGERDHIGALSSALTSRQQLIDRAGASIARTQEMQLAVFRRMNAIDAELVARAGGSCDEITPTYKFGAGTLQLASTPVVRTTDDTEDFAKAQLARLRLLFKDRGIGPWSPHLSQYLGKSDRAVRRIVLNNIAPEAGAAMCEWLRCENWTGGCAFIDERGETNPGVPRHRFEYEPSEDLYRSWRMATN